MRERPALNSVLLSLLLALVLTRLHDHAVSARVWPPSPLLLVLDVWLCAAAAATTITYASRPRLGLPAATHGVIAGFAVGLLLLALYGLALAVIPLQARSFWPSMVLLRLVIATAVALTASRAALVSQRLSEGADTCRGALAGALRLAAAPSPGLAHWVLALLCWWGAAVVTSLFGTHFRGPLAPPRPTSCAPPISPPAASLQPVAWAALGPGGVLYWAGLLAVPTCFALWILWRARRGKAIPLAAPFAFIGVQLGILLSLGFWSPPATQAGWAAIASSLLGFRAVGIAIVRTPAAATPSLTRRGRRATLVALGVGGAALLTAVIGVAMAPVAQTQLLCRAAAGSRMPQAALARIVGPFGSHRAIAALDMLDDPSGEVRKQAAESLKHFDARDIRSLAGALPQATEHRRWQIAWALGESPRPEGLEPALDLLENRLGPAPPPPVRWIRKGNLMEAEPPRPSGVIEDVRATAAMALGRIGDPSADEPLIRALADPKSDFVREQAARSLGELHCRAALGPLREACADSSFRVRQAAAEALGKLGDASAVPELIAVLRRGDVLAVDAAAMALANMGDKRATEPLGEIIVRGNFDSSTFTHVLAALQGLGGDTLEPLLQASLSPNEFTSNEAARALEKYHPDEGVARLAQMLSDPQRAPRAGPALKIIGSNAARKALRDHGWPETW